MTSHITSLSFGDEAWRHVPVSILNFLGTSRQLGPFVSSCKSLHRWFFHPPSPDSLFVPDWGAPDASDHDDPVVSCRDPGAFRDSEPDWDPDGMESDDDVVETDDGVVPDGRHYKRVSMKTKRIPGYHAALPGISR